jgi:membrane protein implicated in regulation of membrane protease activity
MGPAVRASRPNPISAALVGRVLLVGTAIGLFLSLFPFHGSLRGALLRDAQYFAYAWIGSLFGLASARLAYRLGAWSHGVLAIGVTTGLIMTPAMMLTVWLATVLGAGGPPPMHDVPDMLWEVLLICVGSSILAVLVSRRAREAAPAAPAPPKFLERLPLKLRGAELWAVEAEDHYLRLHTSMGQDLILLRLADAVDELDGIEGAQVHRSWWVARDAITDARRGDGRATLTLKDGSAVPVSRTYARLLRERNWI